MEVFLQTIQLRWSDLDPNFHVRHSVFYDWATMCRIEFLQGKGLTSTAMQKLNFGPVIFREECVFKKEIGFEDKISISLKLLKSRRDFSRWSFVHEIWKNDETLCALVTIDGAWMNTVERKLVIPLEEVAGILQQMPLDGNFQWLD